MTTQRKSGLVLIDGQYIARVVRYLSDEEVIVRTIDPVSKRWGRNATIAAERI